jgi:hypothetical protein
MTPREEVARSLAFFELTDDIALLHQLVEEIAPRAKRMVGQFLARGSEDAIPGPADLRAARDPATKDEAMNTLRATSDFALLQVMSRTIGQRIESAEIAASADFPEGTRVTVPEKGAGASTKKRLEGRVERTGTMLSVLLDNGETWEGPPTIATLLNAP